MTAKRGTTNGNARGSVEDRREWLVETYRANADALINGHPCPVPIGSGEPACRCYRCGVLLTLDTVTVDRIIPGCKGGTYRRSNIRPACGPCNSETGGAVRRTKPTRVIENVGKVVEVSANSEPSPFQVVAAGTITTDYGYYNGCPNHLYGCPGGTPCDRQRVPA